MLKTAAAAAVITNYYLVKKPNKKVIEYIIYTMKQPNEEYNILNYISDDL